MNTKTTQAVLIAAILAIGAVAVLWPKAPPPPAPEQTAPPPAVMPAPVPASIPPTPPAAPRLTERVFEAAAFGRYAVRAVSPFGTALHLVDSMAGPGPDDGVPGKRDGRIDSFLDPGSHKAILTLPDKADGLVDIKVDAFVERNQGVAPVLRDLDQLSTELQDLEQRSYWIEVKSRRAVFIEAAGRKLTDLRLWKDGTWLVDAEPVAEQLVPRPGKPLQMMRLALELDPGLYRLTAYGGPGVPWTDDAAESPLHLRMGIPTMAEGVRRSAVAGPFGLDRWLVAKGATHFRLDLPEPGQAAMEAASNFAGAIAPGERISIDKNARIPAGDLAAVSSTGNTLVTVERNAGEGYALQNFNTARIRNFQSSGWHAIAVTTAATGDDVDLGAILLETAGSAEKIIASSALRLTPETGWMRRFNLLGTVSMYVEVASPGRYALRADNVDAEIQVEPYIKTKGAKPAPSKVGGGEWDLEAGFHLVTLWPRAEGRGIASVSIKGAQATLPTQPAPPVTAVDFPKIWLDSGKSYRLTLNQTGMASGAQLRKTTPLLLDEGDALVVLKSGESREASLKLGAPGNLELVAEDGTALPLALDGAAAAAKPPVAAGIHQAVMTNPGSATLYATLRLAPAPTPAGVTPPPAELTRLPRFPVLEAGVPRFLDLGRQRMATFALTVDKPALYRVESTGLLQTAGNLRTQVRPSLTRAAGNGIGRNFLMLQYLRPGLYQFTVWTQNQSAGHLGVMMTASELRPGGALAAGIPARASLNAGEGIGYDFTVNERGDYRFEALTLAGPTELRLEDAEGWPLTNPGHPGALTQALEPGRYRLVVLPQPLPARMVTLVERIAEPVARHGHGPHALPLGETVSHRWEEPQPGGERIADSWDFNLPAAADLTVTLGEGMAAGLTKDGMAVAEFNALRPLAQRLEAGDYRLSLRSIQPNNRLDYTLTTTIRQLIAGMERAVTAPVTIPVAVGASGLVDISSFGREDLRATLRDAHGTVIARADDRVNDWNFIISTRLPPGDYRLNLEPVGRASAAALIRMRAHKEITDPLLAAGGERVLADGAMHVMELDAAAADDLLVVAARSDDEIGLALEREEGAGNWIVTGLSTGRTPRLALAHSIDRADRYRLRAWSLDHNTTPLVVSSHRLIPAALSEARLAEGIRLEKLAGLEPPVGVAAIRLDRPGLLHIETAPAGLTWSASPDSRVLAAAEDIVSTRDGRLWLLGEAGATVKARRAMPPAEGVLALTLPEGEDGAVPVDGKRGPQLWLAESRVGQPGIALAGTDPRISGWAEGEAVAALPDAPATKNPIMRVWRADRLGPLPVTLRRLSFAAPGRTGLKAGVTDGTVAARTAMAFTLPEGPKQLKLMLPPQTAALLTNDGQMRATLWGGVAGKVETLDSRADGLMLLNAGAEGRFAIDLSPSPPNDTTTLTPHALTTRWLPASGELRFDVAAPHPLTLHLSGAVEAARAVHRDGHVVSGRRLAITGDATITLRHRAGLIAAWADADDDGDAWPAAKAALDSPSVPGAVVLKSDAVWRLTTEEPTLLHVATSNPVMLGYRRAALPPELAAWPSGAAAHLFLPRGASVLGLRSLQDGPLTGNARLSASPPVDITEGLGPKLRLGPGDARLFAFTLAQPGPIGIGARGGADSARVRLLDDAGKTLAEGAVTMTELAAGRYYLLVENRADAEALEVQPALVGSSRPDTGPPEDVKRRYWQMVSDEQEVR